MRKQKKVVYYENVDRPAVIVRHTIPGGIDMISRSNPRWRPVSGNSSYFAELMFCQGNCCLFDITKEEANRRIAAWAALPKNERLLQYTSDDILAAKEVYLYNGETLYLIDRDGEAHGFSAGSADWFRKDNFWDYFESSEMLCHISIPTREEAVSLFRSWLQGRET